MKQTSPQAVRPTPKRAHGHPVSRVRTAMTMAKLRLASKAAQSSLRRYPRSLWESLHPPAADLHVAAESALSQFGQGTISALWVGHATVLLSMEVPGERRVNVLTDPVFSERIGVSLGTRTFGLRRLSQPALTESMLPPIDLVLLSHAHFDHLDRPTLRRLAAGPARGATVVTASRTQRLVPGGFKAVLELPWQGSIQVGPMRIDAIRPAHWGARTAIDRRRGFNSYVMHIGERKVLFAGDTAATDAFERVGPVDLSIFGVGAYEPWEQAHATPEQVWKMFRHLRGNDGKLLPMHHSTFDLGEESRGEPLARLEAAAGMGWSDVVCRGLGDCFNRE